MAARVFGAKGRTSRGPHLLTDFRRCRDVVPDWLTCTGGANGTRINSHGVMERVTRSNKLANPLDIDAWGNKTNVTTTRNALASPLNNLAGKLVETTANAEHYLEQILALPAAAKYDFTAIVCAGERACIGLRLIDQTVVGNEAHVRFDTSDQTVSIAAAGATVCDAAECSVEDWGDGWYRVRAVITPAVVANSGLYVRVHVLQSKTVPVYAGTVGYGIYIAGAMLEPWAGPVGTFLGTQADNVTQSGRIDYDPASGRRNEIRNSTGRGFQTGAPGTMGTYWDSSAAPFGLARSIVGWGTYTAPDGTEVDCVDVRYSGVANATNNITIAFAPTNQIAAASGQMWAHSVYLQKVDGTIPVNLQMTVHEFDAAAAYLRSNDVVKSSSLITGQLVRVSQTLTAGANTAFLRPLIYFGCVNGQAFDLTLRIGLPQLERDAVTPAIKTYGWARTAYTGLGLLREPARTNRFNKPSAVDTNDGWTLGPNATRVGVEKWSNGLVATIYKSATGVAGNCYVTQGTWAVVSGTVYTVTIYARLVSGAVPTQGQLMTIETTPGSPSTRVAVEYAGSGLSGTVARYTKTFTAMGTGNIAVYFVADANNTSEIAVAGAMFETGSGASSFTAGARTADVVGVGTGAAFTAFGFNATEGAFAVKGSFYVPPGTYGHFASFEGAASNIAIKAFYNHDTFGGLYVIDGGIVPAELYLLMPFNTTHRLVMSYKANKFLASLNGAAPLTDSSGALPTITKLRLTDEVSIGRLTHFAYWRREMSEKECQLFAFD